MLCFAPYSLRKLWAKMKQCCWRVAAPDTETKGWCLHRVLFGCSLTEVCGSALLDASQ